MLCEVAILMVVMDLPVPFLHVYRGHRTLHFIQHHIYVSAASFPHGDGGKQQTGIDKYVMQTISKKNCCTSALRNDESTAKHQSCA
jgi:hypothetical protein